MTTSTTADLLAKDTRHRDLNSSFSTVPSSTNQHMSITGHNSIKLIPSHQEDEYCTSNKFQHQNQAEQKSEDRSNSCYKFRLQKISALLSLWSSNIIYRCTIHLLHLGLILYLIFNSISLVDRVSHLEELITLTPTETLHPDTAKSPLAKEIHKVQYAPSCFIFSTLFTKLTLMSLLVWLTSHSNSHNIWGTHFSTSCNNSCLLYTTTEFNCIFLVCVFTLFHWLIDSYH